jgi:hypothetical protein
MKPSTVKWVTAATLLLIASVILPSCYKKFDAGSYAPVFTINGFSSVNSIATSNLVGYWSFDDGYVDSVSNTVATNSGTSLTNGFKGKGASFNVANKSYISLTPSVKITGLQSFTISFWVNPTFVDADGNGEVDGIIGFVNLARADGFWGNIDWFIENGSKQNSAIIKAHVVGSPTKDTWVTISNYPTLFGKWSSHTLTYDAATGKLTYYINGASVASATAPWTGGVAFPSPGPLIFGTTQFQTNPSNGTAGGTQPWASYLTGAMDEIRIYNRALTESEVNAMVVLQGKGK